MLAPFISQNCGAGNPARAKAALLLHALRPAVPARHLRADLASRPFIADLFSDHPQVVRLIVLYLHLVPIGYGFQGAMVMLLASALNGVRASAVSLLINGIRLFVFCCRGPGWGGKTGGEQGIYLGMLLANLAAGLLAWGYARHRFERLCHQGRS